MRNITAIALFMLISWPCFGADYYVDGNLAANCSGNYSIERRNCTGSDGTAWKKIQPAVDHVSAGDTVNVRGGTYYEQVALDCSCGLNTCPAGKSGNATDGYITYRTYQKEEVVLLPDNNDNINFGAAFNSGVGSTSGMCGPFGPPVNYVKIIGFTIKNFPSAGVAFNANRYMPTDPATGENLCPQYTGVVGSHRIVIEDNKFYDNGDWVTVYFEGGDEAIGATGHHIEIRNNIIANSGNHGIKFANECPRYFNRVHIHDSIIEGNEIYGSGQTAEGIGIQLSTANYRITVRNNHVHHNQWLGISAQMAWDNVYEGNDVHDNGLTTNDNHQEREGITLWLSRNVTVRNNRLYNHPGFGLSIRGPLPDGQPGAGHKIHHNLIYNNGRGGDTNGGLLVTTDSDGNELYNNVIADNNGVGLRADNAAAGNIFKNNILFGNNPQLMPGAGVLFDYNLYFPDVSFAGKGTHSLGLNPLFVNPTQRDFRLQFESPAIDVGTLVGLTQDFIGTAIPQGGGPDIGAYEYSDSQGDIVPPAGPGNLRVE